MNEFEEIIGRPEIQIFASMAIVRQASRLHLPDLLVNYHQDILQELGIDIDKVRYMTSQELNEILPKEIRR